MTEIFSFDLQRFGGGKGGTAITQTYEPTKFELRLQELECNYSESYMIPHAPPPIDTVLDAINMSNSGYHDEIQMYDAHYLNGLIEWINDVPVWCYQSLSSLGNAFSKDVTNAVTDYGKRFTAVDNALKSVPAQLAAASTENAKTLSLYIGDISDKADTNYSDLDDVAGAFSGIAEDIDRSLVKIKDDLLDKADDNYSDIGGTAVEEHRRRLERHEEFLQ